MRIMLVFVALLAVTCSADDVSAEQDTCSAPRILSYHADRRGVNGMERDSPHSGLDFDAQKGDSAISAAPGKVVYLWGKPENFGKEDPSCGFGVLLRHTLGDKRYFTRYCHLDEISVEKGQELAQGTEVGKIGTTGRAAGIPHLHFELCTGGPCYGYFGNTVNPLPHLAGYHNPDEIEASALTKGAEQKIRLTYPVRCPGKF